MTTVLTPELLLRAYGAGVFPMAESRGSKTIVWFNPLRRGILPLDSFHISRSLARRIRSGVFDITLNRAFGAVVEHCADRKETWINSDIMQAYTTLHHAGHCHSLEVWEKDTLVGGIYGIAMGAAFFGESMFSKRSDASKVALAYLTHRLWMGGFQLFDTQYITPHLQSLGAIEISRIDYHERLGKALTQSANFFQVEENPPHSEVLRQRRTHTS